MIILLKLYINDSKLKNDKRFLISDEKGNLKYTVSIDFTSSTLKMDIYDVSYKKVAKIRKRDILCFTIFTISCDESLLTNNKVRIVTNLLNVKDYFSMYGVNWLLRGDILSKNFELIDVDKSVVMYHKRNNYQSNMFYELDIFEKEEKNIILCICIALCIDILNVNLIGKKINPMNAVD